MFELLQQDLDPADLEEIKIEFDYGSQNSLIREQSAQSRKNKSALTKVVIPRPLQQPGLTDNSDIIHPTLEDDLDRQQREKDYITIQQAVDEPPQEEDDMRNEDAI